MFSGTPFVAALVLATTVSSSLAATIIDENFNNLGNSAYLASTIPAGVLGMAWQGPTTGINMVGNGSGGLTTIDGSNASAAIDLGDNYLTSNPGVYTLTLTITQPSGTNAGWTGFGFSNAFTSSTAMVNSGAAPWMIYRNNGQYTAYSSGTTSMATSSTGALTGTHTFVLRLDTSVTSWTVDATIDGNVIDLNSTDTGSTTFTYSTNPVTARYVNISTGGSGTATASVDNFSLIGPVPEPTSAAMLIYSLPILLGWRRMRRH